LFLIFNIEPIYPDQLVRDRLDYDKTMIEISHRGGIHGMVGIYGSPKTLNKINR